MGFSFKKSFNLGPFRLNLSKSGIGYSIGTKGLRFTKKQMEVIELLHLFLEQEFRGEKIFPILLNKK